MATRKLRCAGICALLVVLMLQASHGVVEATECDPDSPSSACTTKAQTANQPAEQLLSQETADKPSAESANVSSLPELLLPHPHLDQVLHYVAQLQEDMQERVAEAMEQVKYH